ncbi:MAG TPA: LLM class flavin-dependent oxidoreductase [Thermomicrobiales bacterium]|nr:LLM class flavin-dependent oxidoreductase [Thermomicrobiales bacterium]
MLGKRVGLGLAARGDVRDAVEYARRAERAGLEAVWLHDSYFERDAVTYLAAIAAEVREIRVGAGALNPYTRHPVALAMTASALDDLAPGRFALALGSGLPLRLAQMAIPYDDTVARVSECIDTLRALWRGDRVPLNPAVPPVQPMFPPPHRVPIFIAGYQRRFVELCGQKADGYLARPAESVPALRSIRRRAEAAAVAAGRDPGEIEFAGYVLCLIEVSRRAALNRAKREPFVIYMMSVLSDVSLKRAGFPRELRDEIAAAWRAEDYHRAGGLIPDELLDAFLACGTAEDVAARAADYHDAGLDVPLLQPVLQEEEQVDAVIAASVLYGTAGRRAGQPAARPELVAAGAAATSAAAAPSPAPALLDEHPGLGYRVRRRASAWHEILRPFSFTATLIPVAAGGALALQAGQFSLALFLVALVAALGLHAGTNIINEIYDVRLGIDSITSPRASRAILKGLVGEREAFALAFAAFALATLLGAGLVALRGWPLLALGVAGLAGGYFYTAPPFQYKYRALGLPLVFLLMGPLMVAGSYYAITGRFTWTAVVASVPVGLLVAAILHGNEWRDIGEDARYGFRTLSSLVGWRRAHAVYVALVVGAYISVALAAMAGALPVYTLLAVLSLPLFVVVLRSVELGATGQVRAIAMLDLWTARLHLLFGALLVAGLALAALR